MASGKSTSTYLAEAVDMSVGETGDGVNGLCDDEKSLSTAPVCHGEVVKCFLTFIPSVQGLCATLPAWARALP